MLRKSASFIRWRLKPNRWVMKGINVLCLLPRRLRDRRPAQAPNSVAADVMRAEGFLKLRQTIEPPEIDLSIHAGQARGKAFIDLRSEYKDLIDPIAMRLIADPQVGKMIMNYFDGRPWLWNLALNFSEPSDKLLDSQLWHFDYGDLKQLHLLAYFTNVTAESGPFTFLPKRVSEKVKRHPLLIERMTDSDLRERFDIDVTRNVVQLTGSKGDVFANDPGMLMHQGARCTSTRLVLFITFTSESPMSRGGRATIEAGDRKQLGARYVAEASDPILPPPVFA